MDGGVRNPNFAWFNTKSSFLVPMTSVMSPRSTFACFLPNHVIISKNRLEYDSILCHLQLLRGKIPHSKNRDVRDKINLE